MIKNTFKKMLIVSLFLFSFFCIFSQSFFLKQLTLSKLENSTLPDVFSKSIISAEDKRFFFHFGLDPLAITRASIVNIKNKKIVQGGSTITQQLAKNMYLSNERTFKRKFKELFISISLEISNSKNDILEKYSNIIYFGNNCYGIDEASSFYFNKTPNELTLSEASLIAGIPQSPNKFSPNKNFKLAKERQKYVLERLYNNGYISLTEYIKTSNQTISINPCNKKLSGNYINIPNIC